MAIYEDKIFPTNTVTYYPTPSINTSHTCISSSPQLLATRFTTTRTGYAWAFPLAASASGTGVVTDNSPQYCNESVSVSGRLSVGSPHREGHRFAGLG